METIPYRNTKIHVKTIPKGTLLFRLVKKLNQDELRGVPLKDGTRCINSNHNVFFYPNPFIGDKALNMWMTDYKFMRIYILKKDVKVIWLLNPSKYSRTTKNTKRNFITRCTNVDFGCLPKKPMGMMAKFNPCVSKTMITKYPDIVGMISIAVGDAFKIGKVIRHKTMKNKLKYFHTATDSLNMTSIPELVLHPLAERPQKPVIVSENDVLDNNYDLLKTFSKDDQKILTFMEQHATYDPETFFFTYK